MDFITNFALEYGYPKWIVISAFLFLIILSIFIIFLVVKIFEPKYRMYKEDKFYNLIWKWKYKKDKIIDLWCYCPMCGSMLVVDDEHSKTTSVLGDKITFFICNECEEREVGRVVGGDRKHALKMVERKILEKIRLKTFDIYKKL